MKSRYKKANLEDILRDFGEDAVLGMKNALVKGADEIAADARRRVPVDTGALRDSIHTRANKDGTRIKIVADAKNPNDGVPYGKLLEFSPRLNRPFLYPAFDAHVKAVRESLIAAIRKAARHR